MTKPNPLTRRGFLSITAGTSAGVGLLGCSDVLPRFIRPQVIAADDITSGVASFYKTVCRECAAGCGLMARVREGRAVKVEGNPDHPLSLGALCVRGQAAIEGLYSPSRLHQPLIKGKTASWSEAQTAFGQGIGAALQAGKQVVVVTRPERGVVGDLLRNWLTALGQSPDQVLVYDAAEPTWLREAAQATFGVNSQPTWRVDQAKTVLSLGADLVEDWDTPVAHARALAQLRSAQGRGRFLYVGPRLSATAATADAYHPLHPGAELPFVLALLHEVLTQQPHPAGVDDAALAQLKTLAAAHDPALVAGRIGIAAKTLTDLAHELLQTGPALVVGPGRVAAGEDAVAVSQAVYLLNLALGAVGNTLVFHEVPAAPWAGPSLTQAELAARVQAGKVGAIVVHQCNPLGLATVFAPLADALHKVPWLAVLGHQGDETAQMAQLVLPDHHFLESWGEVDSQPGIHGLQQPVMTPLHDTRAAADVLLGAARQLTKTTGLPEEETFALYQRNRLTDADVERGGVFTVATPRAVTLTPTAVSGISLKESGLAAGPVLIATPSLRYLDGMQRQSPLVSEVPDALTAIAWSGWVEVNPETAATQGLVQGDELRLKIGNQAVNLPVFVTPTVAPDVLAVPLGHATALLQGRQHLRGRLGNVQVARTGQRINLPSNSGSLDDQGRDLAKQVDAKHDQLPEHEPLATIQDPEDKTKHRWALAVDLDKCNGCGACVAACHVENNVPIVGADQFSRGRDMSWIRIQRYMSGTALAPKAVFVPSMCQQCGSAPCETVCPAYATYHTADGLNAQIYNRCIGTRYCSNNCPYVARRFNWFQWPHPEPSHLGLNPDVTVRERGVMEKCTFCVQRIRDVEERARLRGEPVRDGEIVPACGQTCATGALVFGDANDPKSQVSQLMRSGRAYKMLEELGTRPGVTYLARRRKENA